MNGSQEITWTLHKENPLIAPPWPSPIIADPSLLLPETSPDGKWHLIAHSILGLHSFTSEDGIHWSRPSFLFANAMRPYLYQEGEKYYLFYERYRSFQLPFSWVPFPKWKSRIEVRRSKDLKHWSKPHTVLLPHLSWHESKYGKSISNPCLIKVEKIYRLYYSASLERIEDCGFCEPRYIGYAESEQITGPYTSATEPMITPEVSDPHCNLAAGAMKVVEHNGQYLGFQNGIYVDERSVSGSAILLLKSADGITWSRPTEPILKPTSGWMRSHVYALDVKRRSKTWYLYFNARDDWHWTRGKEKIGLLLGEEAVP